MCLCLPSQRLPLLSQLVLQVVFHIYKDAELKPLLDSANEQHQKEKESEA